MRTDKNVIIVEGEVIENLPNTMFRVKLAKEYQEKVILCHASGKIRKHYIKILPGDRVKVEISAYDTSRGKICFRI